MVAGQMNLIEESIADPVHGALDATPQLGTDALRQRRSSHVSGRVRQCLAARLPGQLRVERQRLRDDLVHVVVR